MTHALCVLRVLLFNNLRTPRRFESLVAPKATKRKYCDFLCFFVANLVFLVVLGGFQYKQWHTLFGKI
jgi:hypothetical protein